MLSNVFTHRSTVGISLAQFLQTERRARGKMEFGYHLTRSSSLAELCLCFDAGEYHNSRVWVQSSWDGFWSVCQLCPSLEVPGPPLKDRVAFRGWAGEVLLVMVHFCSPPAQGLYFTLQGDAGSIKASFHQHRSTEMISNSRISFYSAPQSILTSFRQGECCCFTVNALHRKYIKPSLWPCLTSTLQINGSR